MMNAKQMLNGNAPKTRETTSRNTIKQISNTVANDIQKVGVSNLNLNDKYYASIIKQADKSFRSALIAASIGLVFFLLAAAFLVFNKQNAAQLSLITSLGAAITTFVSGTSFYLYKQTMKHFEAFHLCLARTEIVLLEKSICEQIEDQTKRDTAYKSIVEKIENLAVLINTNEQTGKGTMNKKTTSKA